jgi:2,5-dioxopentanoate dehydrogenase
MELTGRSILGSKRGEATGISFRAYDPRTAETVGPDFYSASGDELATAAALAEKAKLAYGNLSGRSRSVFLRKIADNIEALADTLLNRASLESGLPKERFIGERARTCGQLRMFADLLDEGSWVDARIDRAMPARQPLPRPDVRSMLRPLGPVAVFCASNFPLAYSVAGGDTASALAAGCPVIVNAHSAHPGTAELVGMAIANAAEEMEMPEGVFSLLFSADHLIGQSLVRDAAIKAVGFTGSRKGGRALMDIAAARPEPIPVYAEMSSVNPTFILRDAISQQGNELATKLHESVTNGAGQFCTKPGLVFLPGDQDADGFVSQFVDLVTRTKPVPLLTGGIREAYQNMSEHRRDKVEGLTANTEPELSGFCVTPSVFQISGNKFLQDRDLDEEIFGPTTLLIRSDSHDGLLEIARSLEGQLTASIHGTERDLVDYEDLIRILETKVGRLIFNGFSTGVEVCPSMVHGGPYPATSDSRSTAVGTRAIKRFCRLVCYQNFPDASLPEELKESNPDDIWRLIDGEMTR